MTSDELAELARLITAELPASPPSPYLDVHQAADYCRCAVRTITTTAASSLANTASANCYSRAKPSISGSRAGESGYGLESGRFAVMELCDRIPCLESHMGRPAEFSHTLSDGTLVGYGLVERADLYRVRFLNPDGKRIEVSTGKRTKNDAHREVAVVIRATYQPVQKPDLKAATWADVLQELAATPHLRPDTLRDYKKTLSVLRSLVPALRGPADVTAELTVRCVRLLGSTKFEKSKASDATEYTRSANTIRGYVRKFRSLWSKHFRELGYVTDNPWEKVQPPQAVQHAPSVPTEDDIAAFFTWVAKRYPGWELLRFVLEVKALSGCRTLDVCQLKSSQLTSSGITFEAGQTKTRTARTVPLPADLCASLRRLAGSTYLWERYTDDARTFRPGTRNRMSFDPRTLYCAVTNLFRKYCEAHPEAPVKAHDLRRRAVTLTAMATQSVDATAQALGIDPQTARKHYLDAQRAFDGEELLKKMAGILRPKG